MIRTLRAVSPLENGTRCDRTHQLVREASDTPPVLWPEAAGAGERLAARLAELEETSPS
jgi:hypothetical protein